MFIAKQSKLLSLWLLIVVDKLRCFSTASWCCFFANPTVSCVRISYASVYRRHLLRSLTYARRFPVEGFLLFPQLLSSLLLVSFPLPA